jgi:hypothetical protein
MSKDKLIVAKGEFSFKCSDGQEMTLGFVMPYEIASKIAIAIMSWKDDWVATTTTVERFQESEKEFLDKLKNK